MQFDLTEPKETEIGNYNPYLYPIIESGSPGCIAFRTGTTAHVVPVFGHSINYDLWMPIGEQYFQKTISHISSSNYLSSYIINDDNLGALYHMHRYALNRPTIFFPEPEKYSKKTYGVLFAGGLVQKSPTKLTSGPLIEAFLMQKLFKTMVINGDNPWVRRLAQACSGKVQDKLILRTLYCKTDHYLKNLSRHDNDNHYLGKAEAEMIVHKVLTLPQYWLTEFSLNEVYCGNRAKLGDVLLEYRGGTEDPIIHLIRLPGKLIFPQHGSVELNISTQSYLPLYKLNDNDK